eukprot:CAMPEP_0196659380 /NCGR_PEP_ID=MMETSP1086-20130531/34626_1 /TAXON_ID=77921 /ORGANISM="Cyanoptyche  gloeocystis , Strain SAG4.97" /LENGTH=80 /DNA_ID=CAMNT_0041993335 /DNA_START=308 /DNA_END=550 /DNA_ORIENTATION=+
MCGGSASKRGKMVRVQVPRDHGAPLAAALRAAYCGPMHTATAFQLAQELPQSHCSPVGSTWLIREVCRGLHHGRNCTSAC